MINYSSFSSFAPHALNQRSPAEGKGKGLGAFGLSART